MMRLRERRREGIDPEREKLVELLDTVQFLVVPLDVRHRSSIAIEEDLRDKDSHPVVLERGLSARFNVLTHLRSL